jgi:hypothetical protein
MLSRFWKITLAAVLLGFAGCQFEPTDITATATVTSNTALGQGYFQFTFVNNSTHLILVVPDPSGILSFHVEENDSYVVNDCKSTQLKFAYNHADKVNCALLDDGIVTFSDK